ncbi:MAG TPA: ABC transporter permease [Humisphaera sp.]|jgi:rhamnose transport system permease protein|nr:ABC transporter permease [Humisphaera sp.]
MTMLDAQSAPPSSRFSPRRLLPIVASQQAALLVLIAIQIVIFSFTGNNFLSSDAAFDIVRQGLEVGLLAIALTPVIVTGGIDLSVGSLMGLSAVILGKLWRDAHWPMAAAIAGTLALGLAAGFVNGSLITRLRIPPLIVTLGTFSLFRGLAEGITHGADNFTGLPESFTTLGQGTFWGGIPKQLPILVIVAIVFWILLHRSIIGRQLTAIGFTPAGARYAGIAVERRLMLAYILCGLISSLAAVIYVAHNGQAKADAGTNYELSAIAAVVLGGTSIFGGRGSIIGTLLGWLAIAILQQGLRLSDGPTELVGILTGGLLILAIVLNQRLAAFAGKRRASIIPQAARPDRRDESRPTQASPL